jgi:hypothetical protein
VTRSIRPARLSGVCFWRSRFADPVSKNRPGLRSASTAALMARSSPGARWISSTMSGPAVELTNPTGSDAAAASVVASSRLRKTKPSAMNRRARVVLPDCRGPSSMTTGLSASDSRSRDSTNLS